MLAVDYSNSAIEKCKSLSNHVYDENFKQLDLIKDDLNEKFKFIYSIAVLHMFVLDDHRDKFLSFINDHLDKDGIAVICILGDGEKECSSNIEEAFEEVEREVSRNNLKIKKKWISKQVPEFNPAMCLIISLSE